MGLLWSILAIGVYLTFRVLDIADLTVEGSFPLGAATAAKLLSTGSDPLTAIGVAGIAGMISGVVTGLVSRAVRDTEKDGVRSPGAGSQAGMAAAKSAVMMMWNIFFIFLSC